MDRKIKISVVIPIYNMQSYLMQCVNSVLSQTLQEIEVICVNDGSTDNSLQILGEYADNKKIIIVNQENMGAGPARNKGIMIAKGKYIAFIDPDDYYAANNALEILYTFAEKWNVLVCCGNVRDMEGNYLGKKFLNSEMTGFTGLQNCGYHVCSIFNLDFLKQNKIFYPNYRRFQDPVFMTKVMINAKEFFAVNRDIYIYRVGHKTLNVTEDILINVINGIKDIFEMIYNDKNVLLDFATYVLEGNREFIIQYGCGKIISAKLIKAIDELNVEICKVLGEKYMLTREEMVEYQRQCIDICRIIKDKNPIIIYGAGINGRFVVNEMHNSGGNIIGVAVTDISGNPDLIGEYKVRSIKKYIKYADTAYVVIAASVKYVDEIKELLFRYGFRKVITVTKKQLEYVRKSML